MNQLNKIKTFIKSSMVYNLGGLIPVLINILLIPIYTRFLTPADYGTISLVGIIARVLIVILVMGLPSAVIRFYHNFSDQEQKLKRYLGSIISLPIIIGLIIISLLIIWGKPIFGLFINDINQLFSPYIQIGLATAFFSLILPIVLSVYQVQNKSYKYLALAITNFLIISGLIVYFVVFRQAGALGSLTGSLIAAIIIFIILLPTIFSYIPNLKKQFILPSIKFGLPLIPDALAIWLLVFLDRIVLTNYAGLGTVGIYSIGYAAGSIMSMIVVGTQRAWLPFFFDHAKNDKDPNIIIKLVTYYFAGLVVIGLIGALFSKELLSLVITPEYIQAATIVPAIILGYIFYGLYFIAVTPILYKKITKFLPIFTLSAAGINLVLNLWWIPIWGMMGAAYATTVAYLCLFAITAIVSRKLYSIRYHYHKLFTTLALAIISYIGAYLYFPTNFLLKLLIIPIYLLIIWGIGIINKQDLLKLINREKLS